MIDSLWSGLSGLHGHQQALNVTSHNISNVNTVAYRSDRTSFADLMYQRINGQNEYGKGSFVQSVSKQFQQGSIKHTGNPYDFMIEGKGFFVVQDKNKQNVFTRAGNFKMGEDGKLQTVSGLPVMGLTIDDKSTTISTNPNAQIFDDTYANKLVTKSIVSPTFSKTINAKATDYKKTAKLSGESGDKLKTPSAKIADVEVLSLNYKRRLDAYANNPIDGEKSIAQVSETIFKPANITADTESLSIYVNSNKITQEYKGDVATTLKEFSDKISATAGFVSSVDTTSGKLTITSLIPGKNAKIGGGAIDGVNLNTVNTTEAVVGSGFEATKSARDALKKAVEDAGASFLEISQNIDLKDEKTLNLKPIQLKLDNLNISTKGFGSLNVQGDYLYMTQGDNNFLVGKLITTVFNNENGLVPIGGNLFEKTPQSGEPVVANNLNKIVGNTLELSNADVGESLVNLMVYQRGFEANSKSITTSDDMLKTAIQLKR
jgi:flagellar hook protein FlgE